LVPLIAREDTLRSSAALLRLGAGAQLALDTARIEWTLFALAGAGRITAAEAAHPVGQGTVVFVPAGMPAAGTADQGLVCLCLKTHLA
jgi:hypothetical protein